MQAIHIILFFSQPWRDNKKSQIFVQLFINFLPINENFYSLWKDLRKHFKNQLRPALKQHLQIETEIYAIHCYRFVDEFTFCFFAINFFFLLKCVFFC